MATIKKLLAIVLLLGVVTVLNAQVQFDTVTMLDGKQMEGKVISMGSSTVKFTYKGETLEYEFKKEEINKIIFASGRTEIINTSVKVTEQHSSTAEERKNKIAVLPFDYITNDGNTMAESMRDVVQTACYNAIKNNISSLTLQDPVTTNAMLSKNNISFDKIKSYTPQEMAILLGVEYIVYGTANVQNKGAFSTGTSISTDKGKTTNDSNKKDTKNTNTTSITTSSGSTIITYNTHIDLSMYNDTGYGIYTESREAFGSSQDAYVATLNYLIKRCPFGKKAKN